MSRDAQDGGLDLTACLVCGSVEHEVLFDGARDYLTAERFTVRRCLGCGLAVTLPRPQDLDRFYPSYYRRYGPVASTVLRLLYQWRARAWVRVLGPPGLALDVGCGDGWMLRALHRRGWRAIGTERAVTGETLPPSLRPLPVFVGGLDAIRPNPLFDVIILFQVLEHLPDPLETLRQCARRLKPLGTLVVAVPNLASWQARIFGRLWLHLDVPRHLFHFSPQSLRHALERVGLHVTGIRYASLEHDPYGWLQSTLNGLGFPQNLLTKMLMGSGGRQASIPVVLAMAMVAVVLAIPSLLVALCSWMARMGALIEAWSIKNEREGVAQR